MSYALLFLALRRPLTIAEGKVKGRGGVCVCVGGGGGGSSPPPPSKAEWCAPDFC